MAFDADPLIDPRKQRQLYGEHLTATAPDTSPSIRLIILAAASTDPEATRVWQDLQHERLCGMSMLVKALD